MSCMNLRFNAIDHVFFSGETAAKLFTLTPDDIDFQKTGLHRLRLESP